MRYDESGAPLPDFVLNMPQYATSKILVTGDNFGCGSSREHAPWALLDFGIRCVVAPSFADIFFNNCFKNGILCVTLDKSLVDDLMADAKAGGTLSVDLEAQTITRSDGTTTIPFDVDEFRRHCLLNGLDDIGITLQQEAEIAAFEAKMAQDAPWL